MTNYEEKCDINPKNLDETKNVFEENCKGRKNCELDL